MATGQSDDTSRGPLSFGIPVSHSVAAGYSYHVVVTLSGFAVLYGAELAYHIPLDPPFPALPEPAPAPVGLFVPYTGTNPRVYDSRTPGLTKLSADEERVVPLGVAGSVRAVAFNLTITETEGVGGFVACFPADTSWPGNSSINWSALGQNIANLVISPVDGAGEIKFRGGNASTHVVIDLVGTYE